MNGGAMNSDSSTNDLPLGAGAAAGAAAWVLNYLFVYLVTASDVRASPARRAFEAVGADLSTWKVVGWVFYNAHFVDTVFQGLFGGATSFVGGEEGFTPLLYLVVAVVLLIAGLAVGRYAGVHEGGAADAAVAGSTTVVGYGLLSAVGVVAFATRTAGPDQVLGILLAGIVYPVVLGATGAVAARATAGATGAGRSDPLG
jgi:hypothetical protein